MSQSRKPTVASSGPGPVADEGRSLEGRLAACREVIEAREPEVRAFRFLDWNVVAAQVECLRRRPLSARGPLFGLPVAVKDIFDTADMPTGYGSRLYDGHRPAADAAAVARLRAAGAIILGKTVTTEFAYWHAGPTRNPLDSRRTPGGSSSGSCAGVAAGMFPLALGSQTAASTIRPAAYCGIVGYKPSRQWISRVGVKALAGNSLDAVGVFARSVSEVAVLASVLAGVRFDEGIDAEPTPLRLGLWQGREWHGAEAYAVDAVTAAAGRLGRNGASVGVIEPTGEFDRLLELQALIMAREAAGDLATEFINHRDGLSPALVGLIEEGLAVSAESYARALAAAGNCRLRLDELFGDADLLAAPSTFDEAPPIGEGTGSPDMSRAWTLLDLPSLTLPAGRGPSGLPLGLQLAARPGQDKLLLKAARRIESLLLRA